MPGWVAALLLALAVCAGCAAAQDGQATASIASASVTGSASPSSDAGTFSNPVLADDFPDPFVLEVDGAYFAYATGSAGANIQVARSEDLVRWQRLEDALPELPDWSTGDTWAPEVARTSAGFVMYYTLRSLSSVRIDGGYSQCISYAVGPEAAGPFADPNSEPLVCQPDLGGSIDATFTRDEAEVPHLVWKSDGNCCGLKTRFFIQELQEDGLGLVGKPRDLGLQNDRPWEGGVIEAPTVLRMGGIHYLFYSANDYASADYAVGYATSAAIDGPYRDSEENPILASPPGPAVAGVAAGPGHQSIIEDKAGDLWMLYHAWDAENIGTILPGRSMWLDELVFEDGKPQVKGPDAGPQAAPAT